MASQFASPNPFDAIADSGMEYEDSSLKRKFQDLSDNDKSDEHNSTNKKGGFDGSSDPVANNQGKNVEKSAPVVNDVPRTMVSNPLYYDKSHYGPFTVIVQKNFTKGEERQPRINQADIGDMLIETYPKEKFQIQTSGYNKFNVSTANRKIANDLVDNGIFKDKGLNAFIPKRHLTKIGVIKDIPARYTDKLLLDEIDADGTEVFEVRRLPRFITKDGKRQKIDSNSIQIVFKSDFLPSRIFFRHCSYLVHEFVPSPPRCYSCFAGGHTKKNCKSDPKCYRCGENVHTNDEDCTKTKDTPQCFICKEKNHWASSKKCLAYKRIASISNFAHSNGLSYNESRYFLNKKNENPYVPPRNTGNFPPLNNHTVNQTKNIPETTYTTKLQTQSVHQQDSSKGNTRTQKTTQSQPRNKVWQVPQSQASRPKHFPSPSPLFTNSQSSSSHPLPPPPPPGYHSHPQKMTNKSETNPSQLFEQISNLPHETLTNLVTLILRSLPLESLNGIITQVTIHDKPQNE